MNQKLLGLLRAVGYPTLFFALSMFVASFGASGIVDGTTALAITGVVGILEHALAAYVGYNLPSTPTA